MDIHMPEMDGIEATRRIKEAWEPALRPRIIAVTTNLGSGNQERYLAYGMDDFISKPIQIQQLAQALRNCQPIVPLVASLIAPPTADADFAVSSAFKPDSPQQPVKSSTANVVIDPLVLKNLKREMGDGGHEVVAELIAMFVEDVPLKLAKIEEALCHNNHETIILVAHTLKSSSALLGATRLSGLFEELETLSQDHQMEQATAKLAQIKTEFQAVQVELV